MTTTRFERSECISQSETKDAQKCHLRWYAKWCLGYRSDGEGPPQRIGSIGHAVLGSMAQGNMAPHLNRQAALVDAHRRGWFAQGDFEPEWFDGEYVRGLRGAALVRHEVSFGKPVVHDRAPLVEHRLRATWGGVLGLHGRGAVAGPGAGVPVPWRGYYGSDLESWATLIRRLRLRGRIGIEGQPDLVHRARRTADVDDHVDELVVHVDDYKFRQKPDLGGALGRPDVTAVDPQGAYYSVLLRACGAVGPDEPVVFRQINAYAGPWLSVEDFVEERRRCLATGARGRLTVESGLPSRDVDRMGAMVEPDVWAEAHRVLAGMRHDERLAAWNHAVADHGRFIAANPRSRRQPPRPPERLTESESADARRFLEDLARRPLVQVQTCSLDPGACLELVRDMLAAVLAAEEEVAAGLPPARTYDPHPRGACVRPFGCDVSVPCQASLGGGNAVAVLREHAEQGRARVALRVLPDGVGDDPPDDGEAA